MKEELRVLLYGVGFLFLGVLGEWMFYKMFVLPLSELRMAGLILVGVFGGMLLFEGLMAILDFCAFCRWLRHPGLPPPKKFFLFD